ncbi:MAG: carboxypeptidase regulatory-like domain-containing protein [Planctomycetes bacterium]|nr:carboxypeptidase regulatory-like domain-containing protein [Planctomycetota bacterium]
MVTRPADSEGVRSAANAHPQRRALAGALALLTFLLLGMACLVLSPAPKAPPARIVKTAALAPVLVSQGSAQASELPAAAPKDDEAAFAAFEAWSGEYLAAPVPEKAKLEQRGVQAAAHRLDAMARLIQRDPELAYARAVPMTTVAQLPAAVRGKLEERVNGRGDFLCLAALSTGADTPPVLRKVVLLGKSYTAHTWGRRLEQTTKYNIAMHGIAVGGQMALHPSSLRVLEPGEVPDPRLPVANPDERCPVSGVASRDVAVEAGGQIYFLCSGGHIITLEGELTAQEGSTPGDGSLAQSAWTEGTKTVLYIRVNYPDDLTDPQTESSCTSMFNSSIALFQEFSYGKTSLAPTITPLLTMPQNKAYYAGSAGDMAILADARAVASAAGYNYTNYDLDCVRFQGAGGSYGGMAYVGARGCWMKSSSYGTLCHELGHNFGLWHANFWSATGDSVIGPGSNSEYGDSYDVMGSSGGGINNHYNAYEKNRLGWLPTANVSTITASGTYRIYRFDQPMLDASSIYALKVRKDSDRDYWLDYRRRIGNSFLQNGVDLHWDPWASSNSGSHLLDTTPGTSNGKTDAAVVVARTFSDKDAGIHITPMAVNATAPEYIDVAVNIGTFSGNRAPTATVGASATSVAAGTAVNFTCSASDADGDSLVYRWDFNDNGIGAAGTSASKTYTAAGEYMVRCTVSDMKGGVASDSVIVTVGAPGTFRISGQVLSGGAPLEGARVYVSTSKYTWTDSDGTYTLAGLAAGSYTVAAVKYGYTFSASGFTNPVVVGPDAVGVNFNANIQTYSISGAVTAAGAGVSGVTVSDGTRSVLTGSTGSYTISGVTNGSYTLTASKNGINYNPSGWSNPITVSGANLTGRNFVAPVYSISGTISGVTQSVVVSDGTRSTSSYQSGSGKNVKWLYTLSNVPQGTYTLTATLSGTTLVPSGWSNPVTVNSSLTNMNFATSSSNSFTISGTIYGVSQAVTVSDGVRATTSKLTGKGKNAKWTYSISNVPAGTYTLTASLAGYTFSPSNFTNPVTVSANVSGKDFQGTAASQQDNSAPEIVSGPWANPNPVKVNVATTVDAIAVDSDEGPEALSYLWSVDKGPGTVTFSGSTSGSSRKAIFSKAGTYRLRVTVSDGVDSDTATVDVTVKR